MMPQGCDVIGEVRYGSDLTFEEVSEVEGELRERIEALLADFDPVYVDFRSSGDDLGFMSALRDYDSERLRGLCRELAVVMDSGASGRLVAVCSGFGPVRVWAFSAQGIDETGVKTEG